MTAYPPGFAQAMFERSGGTCERCGQRGESIHHRKLRSRGGKHDGDNCVVLCGDGVRGCHGWCHANPKEATETGWMVSSWDDPATVRPIPLH